MNKKVADGQVFSTPSLFIRAVVATNVKYLKSEWMLDN